MHSPCVMRRAVKVVRSGATASSAVGIESTARLTRIPRRRLMCWLNKRDDETCDRHADRAGIDRKAHGRRRHAIGAGQGRQNRLGREQVDDREEGGEADDDRAQQRSRKCACISRSTTSNVGADCAMTISLSVLEGM